MEALKRAWTSFVDFSRSPILSYQKFVGDGDVDGGNRKLYAALAAEFLGLLIFQLYGGEARESVAAYGNGLTLAVCIYATANISGGHLNPAVTLATMITGHMNWARGLLYVAAQLLGAVFGALFQVALIPHVKAGMGNEGPGCFTHLGGTFIRRDQLFGWEVIMTFLLVCVVFAVAVSKPGFGNVGPLVIGFTLFASAFIGGPFTGAALNPARVFGPALVFNCYWSTAWIYIAAQLLGGVLAALVSLPIYGPGPEIVGELAEVEGLQMAAGVGGSGAKAAAGGSAAERQGLIGLDADARWRF